MKLDDLLKPEHRAHGLHLEDDEDFVYLSIGNEGIGIFRSKVTRDEILDTADRYISASTVGKSCWSWRMKNTCNA